MRHSYLVLLLIPLAFAAQTANAETIMGTAGYGMLLAYGPDLKEQRENLPLVGARFNHEIVGRWSAHASFFAGMLGTVNSFGLGVSYDLNRWLTKYSESEVDGSGYRMDITPSVHYRLSATITRMRYETVMTSSVRVGNLVQKVPISADLYGAQGSLTVTRFLTENIGLSFEGTVFSGLANGLSGFGYGISTGASYFYQ